MATGQTAPVIDYQIDVRLYPNDQRLEGRATLTFHQGQAPTVLRLAPQAEVLAVSSAGRELSYTFRNGLLQVAGERHRAFQQLTVHYRAIFNDPLPRDTVGVEDPSFGVSAAIGASGSFLAESVPWFPRAEGVRGRHRLKVTAPDGMTAVAAGRYLGSHSQAGLTVSEWASESPAVGLALAAGRYQVARDDLDGIQLLTFLSQQNADLAPAYLAAMRRHLVFYRELLGPYPYAKFAVVENFLPTGYGLPSWTLLGDRVVRLPFLLDTSLPHEIVHSWWGNAINVDYAQGNWAEGLTTYLADYLLKERDNPQEALEYRRKLLRDYAALVTSANDFPLKKFTGRSAKYQQAIGYGKGAMVFHMLREVIGDTTFRTGLQRMASEGLHASLGWREIESIFSRTAGEDLRWFFRQWVEQAGAPTVEFDDVRVEQHSGGWRVTGRVKQRAPAYRFDLHLRLSGASGPVAEQTVRVDGPVTAFSLNSHVRPHLLEGDPDVDLFRQLTPDELPATINELSSPQRPLVIVAAGQDELRAASGDLLKGLHWDYADIVEEERIDPEQLVGRDLLYLGWPRRPELRPRLPATLTISAAVPLQWQLEGAEQQGEILFAVLAGRQQQGVNRAVLLAQSAAAFRAVAVKISHYGRYSALLFEGGRNLAKLTWEPLSSSLKVSLPQELGP